jgi:hypothetical protein
MKRLIKVWLLILLSYSHLGLANVDQLDDDLTQFDVPILLGDWFFVSPESDESTLGYRAIMMHFGSDYSFSLDLVRHDESIEHWDGRYQANDMTIKLNLDSMEEQIYPYQATHNQLFINGIGFVKMVSDSLAGAWTSQQLTGSEMSMLSLEQVDLVLQSDFIFHFRARGRNGLEVIHEGVYYISGDHLVLIYEAGLHDTRYVIEGNALMLEVEDGSMLAVLNRVQ